MLQKLLSDAGDFGPICVSELPVCVYCLCGQADLIIETVRTLSSFEKPILVEGVGGAIFNASPHVASHKTSMT